MALPQNSTGTSVVFQYPQAFIGQANKPHQLVNVPQSVALTQAAIMTTGITTNPIKTVQSSTNTAKVIDLTDDDDNSKARLVSLPSVQQSVMIAQAQRGSQLMRGALSVPGSYQLVLNPPAPLMRTVSLGSGQTTLASSNIPIQNMASTLLNPPTNISPGASLARAAVPINPTPVQQQHQQKVCASDNNSHSQFKYLTCIEQQ